MDGIAILKDLISIDTSVPPGLNYDKAIAYLEPLFKQAGCQTEKVQIPKKFSDGNESRLNLIAHRRKPGAPRLVFYGHIDVVPAQGWPAFTPKLEAGKLYGRGAADMKGSLAALLMALDEVRSRSLRYDISVMVTTDEEAGQADQLRFLGRHLSPMEGAYLFDLDSSFGHVTIASLGALQIDIKVKGKSVHSGLAHMGENAVEKANLLVSALLKYKGELLTKKSAVQTSPETGLKFMEPRLNINVMRGGLKVNIVPDECLISIDRRLIPEENMPDAEEELFEVLRSVPGVNWEAEQIFRIPVVPPADDPLIDELAATIERVTGKTGKYGEMGSGDLGHIAAFEWKAKHFGSGVIRPECNIHGKNEFVYCEDVRDLAAVIAAFISS